MKDVTSNFKTNWPAIRFLGTFSGALVKLRKGLLELAYLSVLPYGTTWLPLDIFLKNDFWVLENLSRKFKFHPNITRMTGTLHEDRYKFLVISCSPLLNMIFFQKKVVEKLKTYFLFNNSCRKSCRLWDNVEKYSGAGQATDGNTEHALCMLYG